MRNHLLSGLLTLWAALALPQGSRAQGSLADYDRAASLRNRIDGKVTHDQLALRWSEDGSQLWYRVNTGPKSHLFYRVDINSGTKTPAFDHEQLADAWTKATGEKTTADRLPFRQLQFTEDLSAIRFQAKGRSWSFHLKDQLLKRVEGETRRGRSNSGNAPTQSRNKGGETHVTFINKTPQTLTLNWVTTEGRLQVYGEIEPGKSREQHTYAGHVWKLMDPKGQFVAWWEAEEEPAEILIDGKEEPRPSRRRTDNPNTSHDSRWRAFFKDHNLWIEDLQSGKSFPLSKDGEESNAYGGRVQWAPDSSHLFVFQTEPAEKHEIHFVESSPKDQLQPRLHTLNYLKPGDRIAHPHPRLFSIEDRRSIPISEELMPNPWSLNRAEWAPDSQNLSLLYNERGHQTLRLLKISVDGSVTSLIEEHFRTFIDYSQKTFLHRSHETGEGIWMSERDGWNHLYRFSLKAGEELLQLTKGNWVVRKVLHVDDDTQQIWFMAGGVHSNQDPYYQHLCRVNADGSGFIVLTEGDGTHDIRFSPDRKTFVDQWSRVDLPPVHELRDAITGRRIALLEKADDSALIDIGWHHPERFIATGRDNKTPIHGIIIKPTQFNSKKHYPVIEYIYAGPHGSFVPKDWKPDLRWQAIAELGFIIVRIDGMGTNWRSKEFHDIAWKNIKDAGFPDRIKWIREAAKTRPWMDLSKVGIFGGSAGGQNTLSGLLHHGDFYKVGVSDCGCHDNRMDKIWWNEAWMGWPIDESYAKNSNVTHAHKLQGKLMLVVGELDRNVDPASTMQVVDALIKADKDFDLLVMPGVGHGAAERPYASRRRMDFFVRHLLGKDPRWK